MGARSTSQRKGKQSPVDLIVPAARRNEYSVHEIRQSTRAINAALESLTEREQREFKEQLPRGLLGGFEAVLKFADDAADRLAGNHRKRRELLGAMEALPFTSHEDLLRVSPEHLRRATLKDLSGLFSADAYMSNVEMEAIVEDAEAALLMVKFLAILAVAARRIFPASLSLLLLFLLISTSFAAGEAAARLVAAPAPVRVTRPPGQLVLAEPRVTRAPGRLASLTADRSEGRAGLGAPWGSASLT
ncbi:hypothetical protein [Amycolatopsis samaneae]|uniref:Uncharacterized protein n=1 Tax=Amycolatopsis samaneae TaxID=664691 RepID=A0ABW5GTJ3_9PSEU